MTSHAILDCSVALLLVAIAHYHRRDYVRRWTAGLLFLALADILAVAAAGPMARIASAGAFLAGIVLEALGTRELADRGPAPYRLKRRLLFVTPLLWTLSSVFIVRGSSAAPIALAASAVALSAALCRAPGRRSVALLGAAIVISALLPLAALIPELRQMAAPASGALVAFLMILCIFEDYNEATELASAQIEALAYHDSLTGLPNRSQFFDRLIVALSQAERYDHRAAVLFFDIDRFKNVNDSLGHTTGDALLKAVASRVRGALRISDTLSRFGGDEFTILLPRIADIGETETVARKILELVSLPIILKDREIVITTSIGISIYPDDARDAESLVRTADVAMYRAKEQGRNTWQFYAPAMSAGNLAQLELESRLHNAAERGELQVWYQPQIDLRDQTVCGFEALLRWDHPILGLLTPDHFISLAEMSGAIVPIGRWVLNVACRQAVEWHRTFQRDIAISVNLSPEQFSRDDVNRAVAGALGQSGLDPRLLELEITETNAMRDPEKTVAALTALRKLGVRLSIDDFGIGYSSLNYLQRFPLDTLKLDRSFVEELGGEHSPISSAIISMAHTLGLKVIAEGVENEVQLDFLRAHGCDIVQGHRFATALSASDATGFLRMYHDRTVLAAPALPAPAALALPEGTRSALVVDDEDSIRRLVRRVLERAGFIVEEAANGEAAIESLQRTHYSVMFLDIIMPKMSGHDVIVWMKEHCPHRLAGVIVMTAISPAALEIVAREPVGRVIPKPFDVAQIVAAANECAWQGQRPPRPDPALPEIASIMDRPARPLRPASNA